MTDDLIHLILDLLGIATPDFQESRSVISTYYNSVRIRRVQDRIYDEQFIHDTFEVPYKES